MNSQQVNGDERSAIDHIRCQFELTRRLIDLLQISNRSIT